MIADDVSQQLREAAIKIDLLGASWSAECDRSEKLEAALMKIAEGYVDMGGNRRNHEDATQIARTVLGLDDGKQERLWRRKRR